MFKKIVLLTAFLAWVVIILGTYVRYSGATLGCPDWPLCYGEAMVSHDLVFKTQADLNFPNSPFDFNKAWTVMTHRYVIGFLGLFVLLLALFSWTQKHCRLAAVISTSSLLIVAGLQTTLGLWVIATHAMPAILTGYLTLGFILFWLLFGLYLRVNPNIIRLEKGIKAGPKGLARLAMWGVFLQIVLGGWVSTNQAGLACADFPRCNGQWMPAVNYLYAIDFWSGFIRGYNGVLSFEGQVAIHWLHRVGGLICFALLTLVMLRATSAQYAKSVRKAGLLLSLLLLAQMALGIASVKLELPLWITLAHHAVAALLMLPLQSISFYSKYAFVDGVPSSDVIDLDMISDVTELIEPVVETPAVEAGYVEPSAESLYLRLKTQLKKTRTGIGGVLSSIPLGQKEINEDLLEDIESSLIMADMGIDATTEIISQLTERLERRQLSDSEALETALKQILLEIVDPCSQPLKIPQQETPFVILVVGINGVGKTTTIGKLAKRLQVQGHSVMLAAGDTFRAAAVEQLQVWGERNDIHVVAQHTGADSASVIYDAVQSAQAKNIDVLIADTAGRLHTKSHLMDELSKIKRIMGKVDPTAPHEVLLVLDAGTGQNALSQTKIFNEVVALSGLVLTKLDGTAKGGIIFALAQQFAIPVRYIGIGEGIDDLQDFDAKAFIDALFVKE